MTIKLRDDVTGQVSKLVGEQMQKQFDFFEQSSAASGGDYKFLMRVEMLDGGNGAQTPNILETWECYGCYVRQAQYNTLSYGNQEMLTIDLTIQPDNCIQISGGADAPTSRRAGTAATAAGSRAPPSFAAAITFLKPIYFSSTCSSSSLIPICFDLPVYPGS